MLLKEGVCYDQCLSLSRTLLAFALLHSTLQGQICLLLQVSKYLLTSCFCIPVPYDEKTSFGGLVLEGLVCLHRNVQLQLLQHYWLGHRLGLVWNGLLGVEGKIVSPLVF